MSFIRHPKDFYSGLMFVAFGIGAIAIGSNYALGTAARVTNAPAMRKFGKKRPA